MLGIDWACSLSRLGLRDNQPPALCASRQSRHDFSPGLNPSESMGHKGTSLEFRQHLFGCVNGDGEGHAVCRQRFQVRDPNDLPLRGCSGGPYRQHAGGKVELQGPTCDRPAVEGEGCNSRDHRSCEGCMVCPKAKCCHLDIGQESMQPLETLGAASADAGRGTCTLTRGPPLEPQLVAASVWM